MCYTDWVPNVYGVLYRFGSLYPFFILFSLLFQGPLLATATINVARLIGRYLSMIEVFSAVSKDVTRGLLQIVEYYVRPPSQRPSIPPLSLSLSLSSLLLIAL